MKLVRPERIAPGVYQLRAIGAKVTALFGESGVVLVDSGGRGSVGLISAGLRALGSSLEMVRLIVLIYPEGRLTIGGPTQPFMGGTGLMAMEGNVPIVPLRLHIHRLGWPYLITFLRRSDVEIRFGKPLTFPPGTPYTEVTRAIEEAVKAL